ncbi:hypothetical protein [Mucilaginibacter gilvus]|uniref:Uncharacterized protein n=1 Tax=Mucilaginibacter gilvus TaxID=2305909 RepID=A0A444MRV1_9SPHI|nr:hypothetical protein [Mucilaginibacter gilvus]RWY54347.1 hypothetical protein EPL05_09950 [Mucilaginibacter gilvus]
MKTIVMIQPVSAEKLFDLLKKEFPDYINSKLDSSLAIDFAHVYDVINVLFPEVIEGVALTVIITDNEITVSNNAVNVIYNTALLEEQLINFITDKCS